MREFKHAIRNKAENVSFYIWFVPEAIFPIALNCVNSQDEKMK